MWDIKTKKRLFSTKQFSDAINTVDFSPDGRSFVFSVGVALSFFGNRKVKPNSAYIADADSGEIILELKGHNDAVSGAFFNADGSLVSTSSLDKTVRIWDAKTGRKVHVLQGHTGGAFQAEFSPDGRTIATTSFSKSFKQGEIRIWDVSNGRQIWTAEMRRAFPTFVKFNSDGSRVAVGASNGIASIWQTTTGKEVARLVGHKDTIYSVDFHPTEDVIATLSSDGTARLWNASTGVQTQLFKGRIGDSLALNFSSDGKILVTGFKNLTVLWDSATGRELGAMRGLRSMLFANFTPDGRTLATGGKSIRLWNLPPRGQGLINLAKKLVSRPLSTEERKRFDIPLR